MATEKRECLERPGILVDPMDCDREPPLCQECESCEGLDLGVSLIDLPSARESAPPKLPEKNPDIPYKKGPPPDGKPVGDGVNACLVCGRPITSYSKTGLCRSHSGDVKCRAWAARLKGQPEPGAALPVCSLPSDWRGGLIVVNPPDYQRAIDLLRLAHIEAW